MARSRSSKKKAVATQSQRPRKHRPRSGKRRELLLILVILAAGLLLYVPSAYPCQTLGGGFTMLATALVLYLALLAGVSWQSRKREWSKSMLYSAAVAGIVGAPGVAGGGIALLNYGLDDPPRRQTAEVLRMTAEEGQRQTRYFVQLKPWPPLDQPVDVLVNEVTYNAIGSRGTSVTLQVGDGFLGIPWLKNEAGMAVVKPGTLGR